MVENSFINELQDPELYFEQKDYDVRLAIMKVKDFKETFSDAELSLYYANPDKYLKKGKKERDFICRLNLRHAILDLNNSFDLLLQIPWFYHRVWEQYNEGGKLRTKNVFNNIKRNKDGWVEEVEKACTYSKLCNSLKTKEDIKSLSDSLKSFNSTYHFNNNKKFTVRNLANSLKHNHSIKLEEFRNRYEYNLKVGNLSIDTKNEKLETGLRIVFTDTNKKDNQAGVLNVRLKEQLEVDVHFTTGEFFPAKDYLRNSKYASIKEIYNELVLYKEGLEKLSSEMVDILKDSAILVNPLKNVKQLNNFTFNLENIFD